MNRFVRSVALISTVWALPLVPAHAQTRVFVAAQGSDSNPCTFALPCRTFQHAHDTVAPNGEIDVLDPAGYGAVTISKGISIQGHGFSGISVGSGATGITINANATDVVSLNGLLIDGAGVGQVAIQFNGGADLTVENCVIRGVTDRGISYKPATTPSRLRVSTTSISGGALGVLINPIGTVVDIDVSISRVELHNMTINGVFVNAPQTTGGTINAVVVDSVASSISPGTGNGSYVVLAATGQAASTLLLLRSVAANGGAGIEASGAVATVRLAQSALMGNSHGFTQTSSAVVATYGDNYIDGNGSNTGSLTNATRQ